MHQILQAIFGFGLSNKQDGGGLSSWDLTVLQILIITIVMETTNQNWRKIKKNVTLIATTKSYTISTAKTSKDDSWEIRDYILQGSFSTFNSNSIISGISMRKAKVKILNIQLQKRENKLQNVKSTKIKNKYSRYSQTEINSESYVDM